MRKTILGAGLAVVAACVAFYTISNSSGPNSDERSNVAEVESVWQEPDVVNSVAETVDSNFSFDAGRIYDISYENDPGLAEFAETVGRTPACVIEIVRHQIDGGDFDHSVCPNNPDTSMEQMVVVPGEYETQCRIYEGREVCQRVKVADHPYEAYSNDELRSLAQSSAEAAVILARRLQDDAASEEFYERAVALSGRPGPLEEWMLHRNLGGLVHIDGMLDVEKAILGYEIYLTTGRLGYGTSAIAEYERVLLDAGVDLEPIRQKADTRFARLTNDRQAIVGLTWEG